LAEELAPIRTQLAYVLQQRGGVDERTGRQRTEDALQLYQIVLESKPRDKTVVAVCLSNMVSLHGKHGLFDAAKRLERAWQQQDVDGQPLAPEHRQALGFNYALVLLRLNRGEQCAKLIEELIKASYCFCCCFCSFCILCCCCW
jgi:hypothetical protein